jgi:hypothetical protein
LLESQNSEYSTAIEAYKDSVRTKEELIIKLIDGNEPESMKQIVTDSGMCTATFSVRTVL